MSEKEQKFLSDDDMATLITFNEQCHDSDADGYTVHKNDMKRLAEIGVVQSHGFGRYGVTSFGSWLIDTAFMQSPALPLKTAAEYNVAAKNGENV